MIMATPINLGLLLMIWRKENHVSLARVASFLAVAPKTVARWEAGLAEPSRGLRLRLTEMMCHNSEQFDLQKLLIQQYSSFVALIDFDDLRLVAVSRGLQSLWPQFCALIGQPILSYLTTEAGDLLADRAFVRRVKQGDIIHVAGTSERFDAAAANPVTRHRWSASYKTFATRLIAEVWYDPLPDLQPLGVHEIISFQQAVVYQGAQTSVL